MTLLKFAMFTYRHFSLCIFLLCLMLSGPIAYKKHHFAFDASTLHIAEQKIYKKIQGLSNDGLRALNVMARTVYGETRNQHKKARTAVAHVILNRSRSMSDIPTAIFKRKQFTCWYDHNRPCLLSATTSDKAFIQALDACLCAIQSDTDITQGADHYHATYTHPYWMKSKRLQSVGRFGDHIFYKKRNSKRRFHHRR